MSTTIHYGRTDIHYGFTDSDLRKSTDFLFSWVFDMQKSRKPGRAPPDEDN